MPKVKFQISNFKYSNRAPPVSVDGTNLTSRDGPLDPRYVDVNPLQRALTFECNSTHVLSTLALDEVLQIRGGINN